MATPGASRIERIIQEAIERGEFEDLPGTGKPLPGAGTPDDALWWVRGWLKRVRQDFDSEDQDRPSAT